MARKNAPSRKKSLGYYAKVKKGKETFIWLDAENYMPLGVIVKKSRG